jgi:hypothetical protein
MMVLLMIHQPSPELRSAASGERIIERLVVAESGTSERGCRKDWSERKPSIGISVLHRMTLPDAPAAYPPGRFYWGLDLRRDLSFT